MKVNQKKKILLVNAHYLHRRGFIAKLMAKFLTNPLLTLPYVASSIPEEKYDVIAVDDAYKDPDFDEEYDLVAISTVTPAAPRAYQIADRFRESGKKVIMGGLHPSALPFEAIQHADSVVIGEAESSMPKLLSDFEKGKLKRFYKSERIEENNIILPRRDIYKIEPLAAAVQTSRGCPYGCKFCILTSMHGRKYRPFPIDKIIEDIKRSKRKLIIMLHDASLTISPQYAKALFRRLKPLKKKIICYGSIPVLHRDEEILKLAREAGCVCWALGFETIKQSNLNHVKRGHKVDMYRDVVSKIRKYDMCVFGSFIFGFDDDDASVFDCTLDMVNEWDLDGVEFNILTPFPGTVLYKTLSAENRILTRDWSKYNLREVVFLPKKMSPSELKKGVDRISMKFYSIDNVIRRILPYFLHMDMAKLIYVTGLNLSMFVFHIIH